MFAESETVQCPLLGSMKFHHILSPSVLCLFNILEVSSPADSWPSAAVMSHEIQKISDVEITRLLLPE